MIAENLVHSYIKNNSERITGNKEFKVYYLSDNDSDDDLYTNNNNKLDFNINKYIKKSNKK